MPPSPERQKKKEEAWRLLLDELLVPAAEKPLRRARVRSATAFIMLCRNKDFKQLSSSLHPCLLELVRLFAAWMEDKDFQWPELVLPSPAEVGKDFLQVRNQALKMEELVLSISSLPRCEASSTLPKELSSPKPVWQKLPNELACEIRNYRFPEKVDCCVQAVEAKESNFLIVFD